MADFSESIVDSILDERIRAYASSALYDDVVTALRSKDYPISEAKAALRGIAAIPHTPLPMTAEIALTALELYEKHGGLRKLHYFDAFHVGTAVHRHLAMITSDKYIISNQGSLGIRAISLRNYNL